LSSAPTAIPSGVLRRAERGNAIEAGSFEFPVEVDGSAAPSISTGSKR
jgi:hypothetical protein